MEFNEKLQKLRTDQGLTQEGLAEKLYVSRTAVSKWESGRGYPSIDSLKLIAKYFHVTVDELICGEEMVTLAEQDIKESNKKYGTLICGILDCFMLLLLFIPIFGQSDASKVLSVSLFSLCSVSVWLKAAFVAIICITAAFAFAVMGFVQLIKRKSLLKVDKEILALGILYIAIIGLYVLFEQVIVNYRPIIMPGCTKPEASFPSSHTMLVYTIMGSTALILGKYVKNDKLCRAMQTVCVIIIAVTVIGRPISGVHWFTDILGALLISTTFLALFSKAVE